MLQILRPDGSIVNRGNLKALNLTAENFLRMYELVLLTRAFEEKASKEGILKEIPLYISPRGQEAAEVASACALCPRDWIFWYSRSQGGALVKGVSIETLWKLFYGVPDPAAIKDLLDHKSMLPYVLVGTHLTHASGLAWAHKILGKDTVSIAYFGEGATAEGDFHSALNWASIFNIPVIFFCENNQYAISTPNKLQTKTPTFAQKAIGYGVDCCLVDGNDPFAVYGATKEAVDRARNCKCPTLIEAVTYRLASHTTAVGEIKIAPEEEREKAERNEPVGRMKAFLLQEAKANFGLAWDEEKDQTLRTKITNSVKEAGRNAKAMLDQFNGKSIIAKSVEMHCAPRRGNSYQDLSQVRFTPEIIPNTTFIDALNYAYYDLLNYDPSIITLGQDIGEIGGVFRATALPEDFVKEYLPQYKDQILANYLPLIKIFGDTRIIDTPLDENGIVGHSIGLALGGLRPIFEMQFSGFMLEAFNQIVAEMGRIMHRSNGLISLPIVGRLPYGGGRYIEHHREFEGSYLLNSPGLTIVCPSTAQDCYDLFWASVASDKPVLFFEDKNLYRRQDIKMDLKRIPPTKALEEFGLRIVREGTDITVTAYGKLVYTALEAAAILEGDGISMEILDLRVFAPFDRKTLIESIQKTGRLAIVQEEPIFGGTGGEISATVFENPDSFFKLQAPLLRIGPPRTHYPPPNFWSNYEPQPNEIATAIKELIMS